jgi:hypothetical protein
VPCTAPSVSSQQRPDLLSSCRGHLRPARVAAHPTGTKALSDAGLSPAEQSRSDCPCPHRAVVTPARPPQASSNSARRRCVRSRRSPSPRPARRDCWCPITAASAPAVALLLYCLQDSVAWLALGASSSPLECSRSLARFPRIPGRGASGKWCASRGKARVARPAAAAAELDGDGRLCRIAQRKRKSAILRARQMQRAPEDRARQPVTKRSNRRANWPGSGSRPGSRAWCAAGRPRIRRTSRPAVAKAAASPQA